MTSKISLYKELIDMKAHNNHLVSVLKLNCLFLFVYFIGSSKFVVSIFFKI